MKKICKLTIILVILISIIFNTGFCYASQQEFGGEQDKQMSQDDVKIEVDQNDKSHSSKSVEITEGFSQAGSFLENGKKGVEEKGGISTDLKKSLDTIFNILVIIGTIFTAIVGGILGIQFMIASAEDKAKIKEAMIPYILGSVVIFGAFGIWKLVVTILNGIS